MNQKVYRTIVLDIIDKSLSRTIAEERLEELQCLINTAGGILVKKIIQKRGRPSAKTFLGTGKIQEVAEFAKTHQVDLVIINGILKPNQYQHLSKLFPKIRVWDRTDLILNIFDQHASSRLAQLQIKLARMKHEIPKIYARDATTLFERAGAGIGTRGMGEKGIEAEKQHIRRQIKQLEQKIATLQKTQLNQHRHRERSGMPTVALIGYTNAGKSSLMKTLTGKKGVQGCDRLFATLDTKLGKTWLPESGREVLVADTIGFLSDLPPNLISSFTTTLHEAMEADLLLHVVDASDPKFPEKIKVVEQILKDIGCGKIPQLFVFNKIDKLEAVDERFMELYHKMMPLSVSAHTGYGIDRLKEQMSLILEPDMVRCPQQNFIFA